MERPQDKKDEAAGKAYGVVPGRILEIAQEDSSQYEDGTAQHCAYREDWKQDQCQEGTEQDVAVVAYRLLRINQFLDPVTQKLQPVLGIHIPDFVQRNRFTEADLDRLHITEKVAVCEAYRHNVYLLACLSFSELCEPENALLDRTLDFPLRPVSAFYIEAERNLMVKAFHNLLEYLLVAAYCGHSVALTRQRNYSQPAQSLVGLGLAEYVRPGSESHLALECIKQYQGIHHRTAVIGCEDDGAVCRELLPALNFDGTVTPPYARVRIQREKVVTRALFP